MTPGGRQEHHWNDPDIGIDWGIENPILSEKDRNAPRLAELDADFIYEVRK